MIITLALKMSVLPIKDVSISKNNVTIIMYALLILAAKKRDANSLLFVVMITTFVLRTTAIITLDVLT
jgi:hypothetical protein